MYPPTFLNDLPIWFQWLLAVATFITLVTVIFFEINKIAAKRGGVAEGDDAFFAIFLGAIGAYLTPITLCGLAGYVVFGSIFKNIRRSTAGKG